ncbi:MAG: S26 family signal peptidase [Saprospiraceae bacterium]
MFFIIFYLLLCFGLQLLFKKANVDSWKAWVPGLNFVEWCKLIGRPAWWAALLLIPLVNIFIFAGMAVDMVRSFGKYDLLHSALAVIAAPLYFIYLGFQKEEEYVGKTLEIEAQYLADIEAAREANDGRKLKKLEAQNPYSKGPMREWVEAVVFAVFAAAFIRMFLIEAYVIPTPSMEVSLLVGDFLFVSKAHYGIRTPETIAMIPLLHNRLPFFDGESYLESPSIESKRLPALESIDRNDPVVFNYPEGDSVYVFPDRTWSIHDYRRNAIPTSYTAAIKAGRKELVTRPIDKKDHYIKRAVAVAGDTLQIVDRQLILNGKPGVNPTNMQFIYKVTMPEGMAVNRSAFDDWGIVRGDIIDQQNNIMMLVLSDEQKKKVEGMASGVTVEPIDMGQFDRNPYKVFPHDPKNYNWTVDNFGPLYVPAKGATIKLTPETLAPYQQVIASYEGNDLKVTNGKIYINGQETDEYTFKMDYYWMMGDNRHNSEDSRIWGFVPENHVVGKPLFIWFSTKEGSILNGIRWNRIFSSADKR